MNMSTEEYKLKVCATLDLIALELCTIRCEQSEILAELRRQGGKRTDAVLPLDSGKTEKWIQLFLPKGHPALTK